MTVMTEGFAYEGKPFTNLSEIATEITGHQLERASVLWPAAFR